MLAGWTFSWALDLRALISHHTMWVSSVRLVTSWCIMTACSLYSKWAQRGKEGAREREREQNQCPYNIISEGISHHFCQVQLAGLYLDIEHQEARGIGGYLRGCLLQLWISPFYKCSWRLRNSFMPMVHVELLVNKNTKRFYLFYKAIDFALSSLNLKASIISDILFHLLLVHF